MLISLTLYQLSFLPRPHVCFPIDSDHTQLLYPDFSLPSLATNQLILYVFNSLIFCNCWFGFRGKGKSSLNGLTNLYEYTLILACVGFWKGEGGTQFLAKKE